MRSSASGHRALRAVTEASRPFGLDTSGIRVLKDSNNTIVLLPAEQLVAKVSTSALERRGATALERELTLGKHLAAHGVPIAPPAESPIAGPHHVAPEIVLTFWQYLDSVERPRDGDRLLGMALLRFQTALAELGPWLPRLMDRVEDAHRLFQDRDATRRLTAGDRQVTAQAYEKLVRLLAQLDDATALHGEPHDGNVLWTERGPALIDFEASCTGPREWDLAYLPAGAIDDAFPDRDDGAVAKLRAGVSFCVAAWCSVDPDRSPEVAEAAAFHLGALRRSWLAATGAG
jgi:aminoglycoside phosphotransferase (APT) family kinase protein